MMTLFIFHILLLMLQ